MSVNNNYNMKINGKNEEYYYQFESILIPIIPTLLIIIIALLFRKFSSKIDKKHNFMNQNIKDKKLQVNNREPEDRENENKNINDIK